MKYSSLFVLVLALCTAQAVYAGPITLQNPEIGGMIPLTGIGVMASQSLTTSDLDDIIAHFDTYAEEERQKWNVPGMAIAIVKDGKIVFAKGYGVKTAGESDPVTTSTVFQIGSTSKAFTAALAAMEVDSGRMNWTDPIVNYVPDFEMKDPWVTKEFTITDSLAQKSGLSDHWGTDLPIFGYDRNEIIHALRYAEPVSSFRSQFMYQNVPFLVAAEAIEKTSEMSWEDNLQNRIFTPLNMTSASTGYESFLAAPDHTSLHMIGLTSNNTIGPIPIANDWKFTDFTDIMGPAGGINADIKDMAAWAIFQLGNGSCGEDELITPESMSFMHTPKTPIGDIMVDPVGYYCQGWIYQEMNGTPSILWHNGATLGGTANILLVPKENLGIVILANEVGPNIPDFLAFSFYDQCFGSTSASKNTMSLNDYMAFVNQMTLPPKPEIMNNTTSPKDLTPYYGSYQNDVFGTAVVFKQDDNLTVTIGKRPVTFLLSMIDDTTFMAACPEYSKDYFKNATFTIGPDGTIQEFSAPLFIVSENVPFTRISP
jgi:CubicO group peptidase (beta-lactamase class C family)